MKSEKGITISSLIVYVIAITIIVSIMTVITNNFYKNINNSTVKLEPYTEFTKFNTYFTEEVNKNGVRVLDYGPNYIVFDNEVVYTFVEENKAIYMNKVKICKQITNCIFSTEINNGEEVINVEMIIDGKIYENSYTLKNW